MITRIRGILLEKQPHALAVEVAGIGYEVLISLDTYTRLPDLSKEITLHIHQVIREDQHLLFGFDDLADRRLFVTLLKVKGIGPKIALGMLSAMPGERIIQYIKEENMSLLTTLPGVGKRAAERLLVELKPTVDQWQENMPSATTKNANSLLSQTQDALIALGFSKSQVDQALAQIDITETLTVEKCLLSALQLLNKT